MDNHTSEVPPKRCTKCGETFPATAEYFYEFTNRHHKRVLTARCKVCIRKASLDYARRNPDKVKQSCRIYYQEHKDELDAANKEWFAKNPEKKRAIEKRYRDKYPEKCRDSNKQWLDNNPEKRREYTGRRRQRESQAVGDYTGNDITLMYRSQKGLCWWCGVKLNDLYEIDHRIPVSRGGSNDPSNLCLCCRKCNRSKSDKLPGEWNGRLL